MGEIIQIAMAKYRLKIFSQRFREAFFVIIKVAHFLKMAAPRFSIVTIKGLMTTAPKATNFCCKSR